MTVKELMCILKDGFEEDNEIIFEDGEPLRCVYDLIKTDTNKRFVVLKGVVKCTY